MPLSAGARLGPYEILAAIGAGGMGEVYKARDTRLGRDVAIKVLPAGVAADPERRHRFELEARAVSALNHPHICVLHDIGSQDGTDFLVMEYLDGQTLAERLRKGALPRAQVLELGAQIADALAALTATGSSTAISSPPTSCSPSPARFDRAHRKRSCWTSAWPS